MIEQRYQFANKTKGTRVYISNSFSSVLKALNKLPPALFIVDQGIPEYKRGILRDAFSCSNHWIFELNGGEEVKCDDMRATLERRAAHYGLGSDGMVVAIGGGATLDLAGFFAATYARGIPLVNVPTTLLAMVDTAIGGKCGINVVGVKNLVGAIWHPQSVYVSTDFIESLSEHHLTSGLVEAAKHAMLDSQESFDHFMHSWQRFALKDIKELERLIAWSLRLKVKYIGSEYRDLLNLGHTFAHALEFLERGRLDHGRAVALGIYAEAFIGCMKGIVSYMVVEAASQVLSRLRVHLKMDWFLDQWRAALTFDKKNVRAVPHVVWLEELGKPYEKGGPKFPLSTVETDFAYRFFEQYKRNKSL